MSWLARNLALAVLSGAPLAVCASGALDLADFSPQNGDCFDRTRSPQTAVIDTHVHFRPFGGPAQSFDGVVSFMDRTGVRFAIVYGIGQMLPVDSPCTYYLDCPGVPVTPTLKNDFANATGYLANPRRDVHLTLSMTFFDLEQPEQVVAGIELLDREFPGLFRWAGEVNLVKQALFPNGHRAVPIEAIARWKPFMKLLRDRGIPIAIHSDLGNDAQPTQYLAWIEEVLRIYPDNAIVWMHLGLSRELTRIDPVVHTGILSSLLDRYPRLMVDLSWRVLYDSVFSRPELRSAYLAFLEDYADRILPGSDFLASAGKGLEVYSEELRATSDIFRDLSDEAFRRIALGENYFRLLDLEFSAPRICAASQHD